MGLRSEGRFLVRLLLYRKWKVKKPNSNLGADKRCCQVGIETIQWPSFHSCEGQRLSHFG
ncbi:Uncharacterized protein TCM_037072 [Theobroma cacao]|uniref:Uncharacterized protein n=1 Tax=Theobroma cacao TaxID=3641 RepID=A0A061GR18_THECC|nr:Uncharacterized protein TCM_037072 [Theobroma cacao]